MREKGYEIEVNAHRFRNTYITKLATKGFPVNLIADCGAFKNLNCTMDATYMEAVEGGSGLWKQQCQKL
ncbi:MAG: hypothetical protein Q9N34_09020 [Aquificota bacterium]|nr:hypothetical protein [Aquificota bacterium]